MQATASPHKRPHWVRFRNILTFVFSQGWPYYRVIGHTLFESQQSADNQAVDHHLEGQVWPQWIIWSFHLPGEFERFKWSLIESPPAVLCLYTSVESGGKTASRSPLLGSARLLLLQPSRGQASKWLGCSRTQRCWDIWTGFQLGAQHQRGDSWSVSSVAPCPSRWVEEAEQLIHHLMFAENIQMGWAWDERGCDGRMQQSLGEERIGEEHTN